MACFDLFMFTDALMLDEGSIWQEQDSNEELIDSELNADLASLISNAECAEALLNIYIEHNEESLGGTEQQSDLLMTSGYQEMYSSSQQRNTETINNQGFDNNDTAEVALHPQQQNKGDLGETEQSLDLWMASGYQDMYLPSQPRNAERTNIRGSDGDNTNTWSENYFPLTGSHLPTYEDRIQSQISQTTRRAGNMQLVGNSATNRSHVMPSAISVEQSLRSTSNFSQTNQTFDPQAPSSNENLQSVARNNASSGNFINLFSPDMFMVPFQLSLPNMHQHYVLPSQQTFTLPTYNQNVHPPNIQTHRQTDNSQFYASYYTSAENQSHCNLPGLSTQPTHSHISQNVLSNQQADEIHSTPSTSQHLPTNVTVSASTYYSKLSTYYVLIP
ncbi:hypothetical protein EB796_015311 [Bugula neritina]|uniref:Uncharacterized protein n=1 Tax=Bugula neritina TaxID=10212 RepID=A0A7J7JJB5_BUGNE|nr:hypothetical protein EB796_015311 [Bugula neritina]